LGIIELDIAVSPGCSGGTIGDKTGISQLDWLIFPLFSVRHTATSTQKFLHLCTQIIRFFHVITEVAQIGGIRWWIFKYEGIICFHLQRLILVVIVLIFILQVEVGRRTGKVGWRRGDSLIVGFFIGGGIGP
jgi:uncharacterized membrane protein